jgi:hypothetical protein
MLPAFLVPETTIESNGTGPVLELGADHGPLLLTLGIEDNVEQASLHLSVFGSADGTIWLEPAVLEWPQKFYLGASVLYFDPTQHEGIHFLRAQWKTNRWGRGSKTAHFRFYVFAEALQP